MKARGFLFLFAVLGVHGQTVTHYRCSRYCKEEIWSTQYEIGKTYTYTYESYVKTFINATKSTHDAEIQIDGAFRISVLAPCEFLLKVDSIKIDDDGHYSQEKDIFIGNVKRYPLQFSFQNGRIGTICPVEQEDTEILNFKRGILSVFQNANVNDKELSVTYETDVSGNCETYYRRLGGDQMKIERIKNLEACSHRTNQYLSWNSVPYNSKSKKSPPILRSKHTCEQTFDKHMVLLTSKCYERHGLQPFSNGESGAVTYVKQNTQLVSQSDVIDYKSLPKYGRRALLSFENSPTTTKTIDRNVILDILEELSHKIANGVDIDTPDVFSKLVYNLKNVNFSEMIETFAITKNIPTKRKSLLDAVTLIPTPDAIKLMKNLYKSNDISTSQVNSWIVSLAFTKNPSAEMLKEMETLINIDEGIKQNAILTSTSLIHRFCQAHPQCTSMKEIKDIVNFMESLVTNCVPANSEMKNNILLGLKGIGNAGIPTSQNILSKCYTNRDVPVELRLAAIEAHRRISCHENENLEDFQNLFANINENTEIRIASYLASMECASYTTYSKIKDILYKEETNQVGSFVWTHLTNLQETSTRWKQTLKTFTENDFLRNKFNTDIRKYSRNYEMSTYFDSVNMGTTLESNVIFSEDSYLPRSAMLNFTLDLFGETLNVFEFGARMQGFEDVVENIFSPNGYFPEEGIQKMLEGARLQQENIANIKKLGDTFRSQKTLDKASEGVIYVKVFGNELAYTHFEDLEVLLGKPITLQSLQEALVKYLRKREIDFSKSFVFLDSSLKVPTLLGFPLELTINCTTTLGFIARGNVDVKDFKSLKMIVEGKIYPSVVVQTVGTMMVDSVFKKSGLKSVSTVNSNNYIDGHAIIDGGKLVDLKLNVPKKQINVFHVDSQIFSVDNMQMREIRNTSDNVEEFKDCTPKGFNALTGLEMCYNVRYVNSSLEDKDPYFPLTGSFQYSVDIKKTDVFDSYQLSLNSSTRTDNNNKTTYTMALYFDTPNSRINRRVAASYDLDMGNLFAHAKFSCPLGNLQIYSNLGNKDKRNINLQAFFKDKEFLSFQSSLTSKNNGDDWKYEPSAKLNYKYKEIAAISGSIQHTYGAEYRANLKLEGFVDEPIFVSGGLNCSSKKYEASVSIKSNMLTGDLRADFKNTPQSLFLKIMSTYNLKKSRNETIEILLRMDKVRTEMLNTDIFHLTHKSSQFPLYDVTVLLESQRQGLYWENTAHIDIFQTTWKGRQLFKYKRPSGYLDVALLCSLTCLKKNIDYAINLSHNSSQHEFNVYGLMQLNNIQRLEALLKYDTSKEKNRDFLVFIYYPQQLWLLDGKLVEKYPQIFELVVEGSLTVKNRKQRLLEILGEYKNSSSSILQNYTAYASVKFPETDYPPCTITMSLQRSRELLFIILEAKYKSASYKSHVTWNDDSFTGIVQKNEKHLFIVSGTKSDSEISGLLGLNIYQHFELTTRLVRPFQRFDFQFYWDKDVDELQKVSLTLSKSSQGLYIMDLEYPDQKIVASFILLPSQVTLNVTWGTDLNYKIYLEAGNKIYDVGGIWFGKLETPFKYLEKQEFNLHYYFLPNKAEIKVDISWRDHSINLLTSGSISCCHIFGSFQMNTTLPHLSVMILDFNHTNETNVIKNKGQFVLNKHSINMQSVWQSNGPNISSTFEIISPTDSILPIVGILDVRNNYSGRSLNLSTTWQRKKLSVESDFSQSHSYVKINTPFERFEETVFEYNLIANIEKLVLEIKLDVLKEVNYALISWNNANEAMAVRLSLRSPITGSYALLIKHSTIFGHLEEYFVVTHGYDDVEILALKLHGDLVPISQINVVAEAVLLGYNASLSITNNHAPISSIINARLNKDFVISHFIVDMENDSVSDIKWDLTSNMLSNGIKFRHLRTFSDQYRSYLMLPNGYSFKNVLNLESLFLLENVLSMESPLKSGEFNYQHKLTAGGFLHHIFLKYGKENCSYTFYYTLNKYFKFIIENAELRFNNPWYSDILLNFTMPTDNLGIWRPTVYFIYDNKNPILINSVVKYEPFNSFVTMSVTASGKDIIDIQVNYIYEENTNKLRAKLQKANATYTSECNFRLDSENLFLSFKGSNSSKDLISALAEFKKNVHKSLKIGANVTLENFFVEALVSSFLLNTTLDALVSLNSSIPIIKSSIARMSIGMNGLPCSGQFLLEHNGKSTDILYTLENYSREHFNLSLFARSDFASFKGGRANIQYFLLPNNTKFLVNTLFGEQSATLDFGYKLSSYISHNAYLSQLTGNLLINYTTPLNSSYLQPLSLNANVKSNVNSDPNGATADVLFNSNVKNLKNIGLITKYRHDNKDHTFNVYLQHENNTYILNHHLRWSDNDIVVSSTLQTPLFGNIDSTLNVQDGKANILIAYQIYSEIYRVRAETNYEKHSGETIFEITTPKNSYNGNLVLDVRSVNKYVMLVVDFPNNVQNKLELRMSPVSWQNIASKLYVDLPSLNLSPYMIDSNYSFVDENNVNFLLVYSSRVAHLEFIASDSELSVTVDLPRNVRYLKLNGTHKCCNIRENLFLNYDVWVTSNRAHLSATGHLGKDSFKAKGQINADSVKFRNAEVNIFVGAVSNVDIVYGDTMTNFTFNRYAAFLNKPMLILTQNNAPVLQIWSGRVHSHIIYKSFINISVDHDFDSCILRLEVTKNNQMLLELFTNWNIRENNLVMNSGFILLRDKNDYHNLTIKIEKQYKMYAFYGSLSNNLQHLYTTDAYLKIKDHAYTGHLRIKTPLLALQYFDFSSILDLNNLFLDSKFIMMHSGISREYAAVVQLPQTSNSKTLKIDIKYPYQNENCHFYLNFEPMYLNIFAVSPHQNWKNISIALNFESDEMQRVGGLNIRRNDKYLNIQWAYGYEQFNYATGNVDVTHNVLELLHHINLNFGYEFYKKIDLRLLLTEQINKITIQFLNSSEKTLNINAVLPIILVECEAKATLQLKNNMKTLFLTSLLNKKNHTVLIEVLPGTSLNFHFNLPVVFIYLEAYSYIDGYDQHYFIKNYNKTVVEFVFLGKNLNLIKSAQVDFAFAEWSLSFNAIYNSTKPAFSLKQIELSKSQDFTVTMCGELSFNKGNISASVQRQYHRPASYNLNWIFSNEAKEKQYTIKVISDMYTYGFGFEDKNPTNVSKLILHGYYKKDVLQGSFENIRNSRNLTFIATFKFILDGIEAHYVNSKVVHKSHIALQKHIVLDDNNKVEVIDINVYKDVLKLNVNSSFTEPLSVKLTYDLNEDDFNILKSFGRKHTTLPYACIYCFPLQPLVNVYAVTPFTGYKSLNLTAVFDRETYFKCVDITLSKESALYKFNAEASIHGSNIYEVQLQEVGKNSLKARAILTFQNFKKLQEPHLFNISLNAHYKSMLDVGFSGSYLSTEKVTTIRTESHWNQEKGEKKKNQETLVILGDLVYNNKNLLLKSLIRHGNNLQGELNINSSKKSGRRVLEILGRFPIQGLTGDLNLTIGNNKNTPDIHARLDLKTPYRYFSKICFESHYNDLNMVLNMSGKIRNYTFESTTEVLKLGGNNYKVKYIFLLPGSYRKWLLDGHLDSFDAGFLSLSISNKTISKNISAGYTLRMLSSEIAFDSEIDLNEYWMVSNTKKIHFGFVHKTDLEPYSEIYFNDHRISNKIIVMNDNKQMSLLFTLPSLQVFKAGVLFNHNINSYSKFLWAKYFYNDQFIAVEIKESINLIVNCHMRLIALIEPFDAEIQLINEQSALQLKVCDRDGDCIEAVAQIVNDEQLFKAGLFFNGTDEDYFLYIKKDLNVIKLSIPGQAFVDLEYQENSNVKLLTYFTNKHRFEITFIENTVQMNISSPLIEPKNLGMTFNCNVAESIIMTNVEVTSYNISVIQFAFNFEPFDGESVASSFSIETYGKKIFAADVKAVASNTFELFGNLYVFDDKTKMYGVLNKNNPYVIGFTVNSQFLPYNGFTFEAIAAKKMKLFIFAGNGPSDLLQNGLINPDSHEGYLLFRGMYEANQFSAKFEAPLCHYAKLIETQVKLLKDSARTEFNSSLLVHSNITGNISGNIQYTSTKAKFRLRSRVNSKYTNELDAAIELPMQISYDVNPKILLNTSNGIYGAIASYKKDLRITKSSAECHWAHSSISGTSEISNLRPEFTLLLKIRNKSEKDFAVVFNKNEDNLNLNVDKSTSSVKINDKKYVLHHTVDFRAHRKILNFLLTVPDPTHKNYSLFYEYDTGNNKVFRLFFDYPTFERECGFEYELVYNSFTNFKAKSRFSVPVTFKQLRQVEFDIMHEFASPRKSKTYVLKLSSKINENHYSLSVNAADIMDFKKFEVLVDFLNNRYQTIVQSFGKTLDNTRLEFLMETPLNVLKNVRMSLNTSNDEVKIFQTDLFYNTQTIFYVNCQIFEDSALFQVHNPWKSVGVEYNYSTENALSASGRIYWDLLNLNVSQIGGHIRISKHFSLGVIFPTRVAGIDTRYSTNSTHEYYGAKVYWNEKDAISGKIYFNNFTTDSLMYMIYGISVAAPFKEFEISHNITAKLRERLNVFSKTTIKWNPDESSVLILSNNYYGGNIESVLSSPLLEHDIALRIILITNQNALSTFRVEFEYSSDIDKRLELGMSYSKVYTNIFSTERQIVLKHPASKIDYVIVFGTLRSEKSTNGSLLLWYRDYVVNSTECIKAQIEVAHQKFDVFGKIETNANSISLKMKSASDLYQQDLLVTIKVNDKDPLSFKYNHKFKQNIPSIGITATYGDKRKYNFYLGLPTKREMLAKLVHEAYEQEHVDVLLTAKLNTSQLLWLKLNWNREIFSQFYTTIIDEYRDFKFIVEATGRELINAIQDDVGNQLALDILNVRNNLSQYIRKEFNSTSEKYQVFRMNIEKEYENDALFSKTIFNSFKAFVNQCEILSKIGRIFVRVTEFIYSTSISITKDIVSCLSYIENTIESHITNAVNDLRDVKKMKENAKLLLKKGIENTRHCIRQMQTAISQKLDTLDGSVTDMRRKLEHFFEPFLNLLDDCIIYIEQRLTVMQIIILDLLDAVHHYILNLREIQEILKVYITYISWLEELHIIDVLEPVGDVIEAILDTVITDIKRIMNDYKTYIDMLCTLLFGDYEGLFSLPQIKEIRLFINRIYQKIAWFWEYHQLSEYVKNYFREFLSSLDDILVFVLKMDDINTDEFENILGDIDYTYKPEQGYMELSLPLIIEWDTFDKLPKFEQHSLYQKIQSKIDHLLQLKNYPQEVLNSLKNFLGITSLNNLSPSANNLGMVVGTSHYVTFDNVHFNFAGECSYLLASNFKRDSFSVIINYETRNEISKKKSIGIVTYEGTIEISPEFNVYFNHKEVGLPLVLNSTLVIRNYKNIIVQTVDGLTVNCNLYYDLCSIEISSWLFGKTGGLLGTLDNEKFTDISLPDGRKAANITEFSRGWKLSHTNCKDVDHANETLKSSVTPLLNDLTETMCAALFVYQNSPLSDCFSRISPSSYNDMCIADMRNVFNPTVCNSVAAYREKCQKANIQINMPEMCINCRLENNIDIGTNEQIFDGHNPSSVDVVFVVNDYCTNESLKKLPAQVEDMLKLKGFYDNRYAYVGYGSKRIGKPFLRTYGKSVWMRSSEIHVFDSSKLIQADSETSQAIDAIKFASELDFRPRVPKIFILLQCQACPQVGNIADIYNMLGSKDITLHVINPQVEIDNAYLSLDANSHVVYRNSDTNKIETKSIDNDRNNQVVESIYDTCSLLALGTNGTISNLNGFLESNDFGQHWASFTVKTTTKSPCQKCRCVSDAFGVGKIECVRCLPPAVKYLLNEYESNIMGYHTTDNDDDVDDSDNA